RGKGKKMSELKAAGVKSATCEKEGDGYKVTIVLKREVVDDLDKHPPHHTSVMDPLTLDNDSLDPFTLGKGQVIYGQIEEPFDGARLTAKVNKNGVLDYLLIDAPLQISGKLGYGNLPGIDTVVDGKFMGEMRFTYN
ncbi:MAG TPA: hypothetical protein PKW24_07875, partial [Clostridiales bacterium]|nr:hypothetical protein [Clostridiales bacterium]